MHDRVYRPAVAQRMKSAIRARYDATQAPPASSAAFLNGSVASRLEVCASGRLLFVWMTETVLRGETRMFAPGDARWLGERRRVPQNKPFSPRAAGGFVSLFQISLLPIFFTSRVLLAISSGRAARCTRARTAGAKRHDVGGGCDGVGAWLRGGGGGSSAARKRRGPTHAR